MDPTRKIWLSIKSNRSSYKAEWYKANKDKVKETHRIYHYKTKYKMSVDEYNSMLETQNNVCAVCQKPETTKGHRTGLLRNLSIDHCHTTGKIRGLLCTNCNHVLGKFNDDEELFKRAINYLKGELSYKS